MNACRMLHVEDEPDIREVVEMSLALDPDINLKSCASGADALVAAADWEPDVILMDVMMPVMDGLETLTHLRENARTAKIPLVFMTTRALAREVEHFLSLGAGCDSQAVRSDDAGRGRARLFARITGKAGRPNKLFPA